MEIIIYLTYLHIFYELYTFSRFIKSLISSAICFPFMSINMAINSNRDIESESQVVYVEKQRVFVKDTDNGKQIAEEINDLMNLLKVYNS